MKKWSKSFKIKVLSITSGKTYYCDSIMFCSEKTGISKYVLTRIKEGKHSSFVKSILKGKEITWQIHFIADHAVSLYPAWDTYNDEERIGQQDFSSHEAAIKMLSGGTLSKTSTYYRRLKEHLASGAKLGEPCTKTIKDAFNREWIVTFHKEKGEFIPNRKRLEKEDE